MAARVEVVADAPVHPSCAATTCAFVAHALKRAFPPITWIPNYKPREQLLRDFAGGVVMGVMLVPMGLAYASLLNIPLHIGLWSAVVYSGLYSFFGNTGVLSMGPVAEITLLLMSTSGLGTDPISRARALQTISFEVGFLSLGLCFVMGGTIIRNSFARAVGNAYAAAAGIILIVVQMKDALNITGKSTVLIHEAIEVIITGLRDTKSGYNSFYCFVMFSLLFGYLHGIKRVKQIPSWVPHQLFVVVITILLTYLARLDMAMDLHIVKSVQSDWPPASVPDTTLISDTIVTGVVITLVSFLQMYSIATRFSDDVHANQELFANGLCALLSGFLGTIPGASSFSRSSVLTDINARTPLNSFFSALVVFISVVGLARGDVFYYLPKVSLAAIIVSAVLKLVDFSHAVWLFKHFKIDFFVWFVVFVLTLFLGVAYGILVGIGLSILIVLFSVGVPKSTTLAFDPAHDAWIDASIDDELLVHREVHVWSFDSPLYFINVSYYTSQLEDSMRRANRPIRVIVVNCSGITSIDASSVESFEVQSKNIQTRRNVILVFAALAPDVKEALQQCPTAGFPFPTFATINEAVAYADGVIATEKDLLAPHRPVPAALYTRRANGGRDAKTPMGVVAVVANADRSPKQRLTLPLGDSAVNTVLFTREASEVITLEIDPTDHVFLSVHDMLLDWPKTDAPRRRVAQVLSAVMETHCDDLSIEVKRDARGEDVLTAKWGGVVTPIGVRQAEACGAAVATRLGLAAEAAADDHGEGAFHSILHRPKSRRVTKVQITATTNGESRVTHTGIAFVQAFAETANVSPTTHFIVDEALSRGSEESKAFCEENLRIIDRAMHANTPRLAQRYLHVPGVRRAVESLALTEPQSRQVPHAVLLKVATLTKDLIDAVKRGPPLKPSRAPLMASEPCIDNASIDSDSYVDPLPFPPSAELSDVPSEGSLSPPTPVPSDPLPFAPTPQSSPLLFEAAPDASFPAQHGSFAVVWNDNPIPFPPSPRTDSMVGDRSPFNEKLHSPGVAGRFTPPAPPEQSPGTLEAKYFSDGESHMDFISRYSIALAQFCGTFDAEGVDSDDKTAMERSSELTSFNLDEIRHFDVDRIATLYENATYDLIHNASVLQRKCGYDLRPLVAHLQPLYVTVSTGRFGTTSSDRLIGGALYSLPLLSRLQDKLVRAAAEAPVVNDVGSEDETAPACDAVLPIDMIFTPSAVLTALRNCLAFSKVMRLSANHHAHAALLQEETGAQYMGHIIFVVNKDSAQAPQGGGTPPQQQEEGGGTTPPPPPPSPPEAPRETDALAGFSVDIYASSGTSLRIEAAQGLLSERAPAPAGSASANTEPKAPFANRLGELDEQATPTGSDTDDAEDALMRQHHLRTRQAARLLTKVAPMARVWRLPLRDFVAVVDEMQRLVAMWTSDRGTDVRAAPTAPFP